MQIQNDTETEFSRGITLAAGKFIYRQIVERHKRGEDTSNLSINQMVDDQELWLVDEWAHLGCCIVICLENTKLVETYKKGNQKVFESLVGKTIKYANMTVEPELIRELLPLVIEAHF
jgi:Asp-tRNA(Asn)/Glu-tRNA(Gln) amidotransferase B subunit